VSLGSMQGMLQKPFLHTVCGASAFDGCTEHAAGTVVLAEVDAAASLEVAASDAAGSCANSTPTWSPSNSIVVVSGWATTIPHQQWPQSSCWQH
jgi:hypothetical protein